MPSRAPTPCRQPGCPNLVRDRTGYCKAHVAKSYQWTKHQDKNGNTTERGYGWAWQKLRAQVIQRDFNLCQECKRGGRIVEGRDVDHILSKANGGSDAMDNLEVLCRTHHKKKTVRERQA